MSTLFRMPEIRTKSMIIPNGISKQKIFNSSSSKVKKILKLPSPYILEVASFNIIKGQLNLIKSLFRSILEFH